MAQDIKLLPVDIGAYVGATHRPIVELPAGSGGITIKSVKVTGMAAGTSIGLILATATNVGTPVIDGTVGSFAGTVVYSEGVTFACTLSTPWVAENKWLVVDQASGTAPANTILSIAYVDGR